MKEKKNILVVDDEVITLKNVTRILEKEGYNAISASDGEKAIALLQKHCFDVVLTDLSMSDVDGLEVLERAKIIDVEIEVIIITGYASVETAIEATKKGAFHYLQKPIRPDEVRHVVRQALEKRGLRSRVRELEHTTIDKFPQIVGHSSAIEDLKKTISQISGSESNVVITGESGTGKELVAYAIHESSKRREKRFQAINCASFTDELIANELFGHEKDAFTGASRKSVGLLESADGGTIFFDEVGDMPGVMQAKLLRVVQEKKLLRVGGTNPVSVDIRIIAATNKDLKKLADHGIFRQDLLFRLNVISIHLPSLSERRADIPLLASHFLTKYSDVSGKEIDGFTKEALGLLTNYSFPGNIRELENIIERAVSFAQTGQIDAADLPDDIHTFDSFTIPQSREHFKSLEELEKEYIRFVLKKVGNNKSEAARILGIDRVSLYRRLKKLEFIN